MRFRYRNNEEITAIEAAGYPISVFKRVELSDIDNKIYFADNVDLSIKSITYYDQFDQIAKQEYFTYGDVTDKTAIKRIYSSFDNGFKGVWNKDTVPMDTEYCSFYYIEETCTINEVIYNDIEILGRLGDSFSKCKFDINGNLQRGDV